MLRRSSEERKKPHQYAKKLLDTEDEQGVPEFSTHTNAEAYFRNTYRDNKRQNRYNPQRGIPKAKVPNHQFNMDPPSMRDLDKVLLKKMNKPPQG